MRKQPGGKMGWSKHHKVGLIHHDASKTFDGYTLFANSNGKDAYLIDMEGRLCHQWHHDEGIGYGFLLDDGNLLMRHRSSGGTISLGVENAVVEMDWDGNVLWEHRDALVHHDFVRLPNGNTLMAFYEEMPQELAARVRGGFEDGSDTMYGDTVREITPAGDVAGEWRMWEALDPETDAICPLEGRHQWTHQNALNVTSDGDLLVSFRQIDTVGIVDRATGAFRWKWGPGVLSHQHCPTYLDNGHVLLFDNGPHHRGATYSRVVEVNPATNEIEWEYRGDPAISFSSYHISGAERQPNGNTLICEGAPGRIFEVTADHEIVWEYVNPFMVPLGPKVSVNNGPNSVFCAHRYAADHPALRGKDLTPRS